MCLEGGGLARLLLLLTTMCALSPPMQLSRNINGHPPSAAGRALAWITRSYPNLGSRCSYINPDYGLWLPLSGQLFSPCNSSHPSLHCAAPTCAVCFSPVCSVQLPSVQCAARSQFPVRFQDFLRCHQLPRTLAATHSH